MAELVQRPVTVLVGKYFPGSRGKNGYIDYSYCLRDYRSDQTSN